MCTARELRHLLDDMTSAQRTGQAKVARLAARIFEELSTPTEESGGDIDCYSNVTRALKLAEDNARNQADWFRDARMKLLGSAPVSPKRQTVMTV